MFCDSPRETHYYVSLSAMLAVLHHSASLRQQSRVILNETKKIPTTPVGPKNQTNMSSRQTTFLTTSLYTAAFSYNNNYNIYIAS